MTKLFCDNQVVLHVDVSLSFMSALNMLKSIFILFDNAYCLVLFIGATLLPPSSLQDIFTKALGKYQFQCIRGKLGVLDPPDPT